MKHIGLVLLNAVLWPLSFLYFLTVVPITILITRMLGKKKADPLVRWMCRWFARVGGAWVTVEHDEPLDKTRARIIVTNHVSLYDPFVICGAVPITVRGLELESHFSIPIYGALMRAVGNVPVPDERSASGLKRTYRLVKESIDDGINLVVFPEGSRTRDGNLAAFEDGAFRMARQLQVPITPVSVIGSYRWFRTGGRLFRPGRIRIRFHKTIVVHELDRAERDALPDQVHALIASHVNVS